MTSTEDSELYSYTLAQQHDESFRDPILEEGGKGDTMPCTTPTFNVGKDPSLDISFEAIAKLHNDLSWVSPLRLCSPHELPFALTLTYTNARLQRPSVHTADDISSALDR